MNKAKDLVPKAKDIVIKAKVPLGRWQVDTLRHSATAMCQ